MPGKMLSLVSVAALMAAVVATPHPECEPCATVADAELDALTNSNKFLCCDLSCATDPVAGCGIFGLPIVCKACYDGDDTPAYDADPVDGSPSTTPAPVTAEPVMPAAPAPTEEPVMPVMPVAPEPTEAPVMPVMPVAPEPTEAPVMPVMPVAPEPTEEPVMPVMPVMPEMPVTPPVATAEPVMMPTSDPDEDESMSFDFDPDEEGEEECTACDEASMVLTEMDWEVLEADGYELVCDPTCFEDATMDGCGAFGLPIECRAVPIDDAPVATGGEEGEGGGETGGDETGGGEGEGGGETGGDETGGGEGEGGGETGGDETGEGEGEGGGETGGDETGEGEGEGGGDVPAGACTTEEIAMCADISPAQEEALAMYDNGGKIIVCDPTCNDGVSDPSHCDYFGLGQRCRGCGTCSQCVACP